MKFAIGERAIVINTGEEVTIQSRLEYCRDPDGKSWFGYRTDRQCKWHKTGEMLQLCPQPHQLRKKEDDDDAPAVSDFAKLGSWDQVGWNPHKTKIAEGA